METEKRILGTIDVTPSWCFVAQHFTTLLRTKKFEKQFMVDELLRMGKLVNIDLYQVIQIVIKGKKTEYQLAANRIISIAKEVDEKVLRSKKVNKIINRNKN